MVVAFWIDGSGIPSASLAAMKARGYLKVKMRCYGDGSAVMKKHHPVALEARADDLDNRALISMMQYSRDSG
jgi:hypothetical protein